MARCQCKNPKKPVSVRDYTRVKLGKTEFVHTHCRKFPTRQE